MTDIANKKDATKKSLRALLISSPLPLTVQEVKRDYHSFIGEQIDYKGMGYSVLEDFFRDIEDVVNIAYRKGEMTLTAKADETTRHIEKLVSKQKVPNKKKYAIYRSSRGGGTPRSSQDGRNRYPPRRLATNMVPPRLMVPSFVRNQMQDLFKYFPDGIPIKQLESAFSRVYGTGINYYNFGFQNQLEFLQSLKDILTVEFQNGNHYIQPVGICKQSGKTKTGQQDLSSRQPVKEQLTATDNQQLNQQPPENQSRPSKGRGRRRQKTGESNEDVKVGLESRSGRANSAKEGDLLEQEVLQVLQNKPEGIWASRFPYEFTNLHGKALDYRRYGYMSVVEFVSAMPDVVRIVRPNPQSDWILYDARLPDPIAEEQEKARVRHCSGKVMEAETKEIIQKILSNYPSGVAMRIFPDVYKEQTGHPLPVTELGFDSTDNLFLSLDGSILQIAHIGNEMMLYSMDTEISEDVTQGNSDETVPWRIPERLGVYPRDAVGPGCHYVPVMLPSAEQYVELYVTNVVHPGLFWVMLRHKTKSLALETLMDRLDEAYDKNVETDSYSMPDSLMVPGQVCATLFPEDNNWHRGVITGSNTAGFIEIYYVDYGNTNYVPRSTLRFLKSEFLTLPAQAVQARLANTHPTSGIRGKWKNKSRSRLLELTCHRPLVAYVCEVKNQKMSLCLTDTNDPNVDVHINDVMINEGLATFVPDAEVEGLPDTEKHALEPNYGDIFGWNTTEAPRLPKVANGDNISRSQDSEESSDTAHCYVKWVQLTDTHVLHLINLERVAYIVSTEISDLFWEEDVLTSMLKKNRLDINNHVVRSDEYPQLFEELSRYRLKCVSGDRAQKAQFISLYKLDDLPQILIAFEHDSESLVSAVKELIAKFDPNSPYWKSDESQSDVKEESPVEEAVEEEGVLSIEENQMALQALQCKRKRILQSMMTNPSCLQDDVVNQLNACEVEIMVIKQRLQDQQLAVKSERGSSVNGAPEPKSADACSENERVIRNIIASATKPIAAANIMTKPVTSTTTSKATDMSANFLSQAMPGMLGLQNMAYAQQPFFNPLMFGQARFPQTSMGDLSNTVLAGNLGAGFNPTLVHPMMFQLPNTSVGSMMSQENHHHVMSGFGRGQTFNPSSVGILPGLMPLIENLSIGRGRGSGSFNKQ